MFQVSLGNPENGGIWTYKFLNEALPWSLCLDHDVELASFTGRYGAGDKTSTYYAPKTTDGHRLTATEISTTLTYGIGFCVLEVAAAELPIHTLSEINGIPHSPGPPETPDPDLGTTGDCTIKKLYYTQVIDAQGNPIEEKDFKHFEMSGTTNYISIDTEDDYEIEGWKTSSSKYNLTNKSEWDAIPDGSQHGTSSDTIKLEDESGCLYVLYKKVEQLEEPDTPWDFQLTQSQITRRVAPDGVIFFAQNYLLKHII
jgi:hypothetical protein